MNKDRVFMLIAHQLSQLGTCDRSRVGAVFVRDGRCITWGYNGAPPGMTHCNENVHGWLEKASTPIPIPQFDIAIKANSLSEEFGCRNATHAEANALAFAARQGISTDGSTCYLTLSPCLNCARLLIAAGIDRVVWSTTYRDPAGSDLLLEAGIEVYMMLPGDLYDAAEA